ncbi:MAG: hypothetical protein V3U45_07335 [bacterium]
MEWLSDLSPELSLSRKLDAAILILRESVAAYAEATTDPLTRLRMMADRALETAARGQDVPASDFWAFAQLAVEEV